MQKLGFGFMRLPLTNADDVKSIDKATVCKMVDSFMEQGFTYFDTAYMYHEGTSEAMIKEAVVQRYARASFLLADKMPMVFLEEPDDHQRIFGQQLARCGVDYFDNYLLHNLGERTYKIAQRLGTFAFVRSMRDQGKVKRMGFSFHDRADLLDRILTEHPETEFVQLQINYLDWENESIQSRKCYEVARKHGTPVIVMEPLKGGSLANVPPEAASLFKAARPALSVASWALRYTAGLEGVETVLSGMSDLAQLQDNTGYMRTFQPLDKKEQAVLAKAREIIEASIAIPCTTCGYCVADCPKDIAIPQYFALYNNDQHTKQGVFSIPGVYYANLTQTRGKASACIGCKKCEAHCPQMLPVVQYLAEVANHFEQ